MKAHRFSALGTFVTLLAGAFAGVAVATAASASTVFDSPLASPGFYNGSGNPNEGFTITNADGAEIALGVLYRKSGPQVHPTGGGSTYDVKAGFYNFTTDFCLNACAKWNIEFSLNLGADSGRHLDDITTLLTVKNLSTGDVSSFDPLTTFTDNSGWNGAKNVANGNEATDYGFQNSENLAFSEFAALNFNPLENTSYLLTFSVSLIGSNTPFASVEATINATPLPATLPLFVGGLGVIRFAARRRRRRRAKDAIAA
jgi:hypothetical protein